MDGQVHVALFDEASHLLGTAQSPLKGGGHWAIKGRPGDSPLPSMFVIQLDFGISKTYQDAESFTVAITENPALIPSLSKEQEKRLRGALAVLHEVTTPDEHVNFVKSNGDDPEPEIASWERLARAYKAHCSTRQLTPEAKGEVFSVLFYRAFCFDQENEILELVKPSSLTVEDVRDVMKAF